MFRVAEVCRVEGEHDLGGVLDSGNAFPRPAAVRRAAPDDDLSLQQAPFGHRDGQRGRFRDDASVTLQQPRLHQGSGTEPAASLLVGHELENDVAAWLVTQPLRAYRGRRWPRRRRLSYRRCPARRDGHRRSQDRRGRGPSPAATAGTTSVWPLTMSVGRWCAGVTGWEPGYERKPPRGGLDPLPRQAATGPRLLAGHLLPPPRSRVGTRYRRPREP